MVGTSIVISRLKVDISFSSVLIVGGNLGDLAYCIIPLLLAFYVRWGKLENMKKYRKVDAGEWLSIVNKEADPDLAQFKVETLRLGDEYAVHIYGGYGSLLSPLTSDEKVLDTYEKELRVKYESLKGVGKPASFSLTSFS